MHSPFGYLELRFFDMPNAYCVLFQHFLGRLVDWVGQYSREVCEDCCAVLQHRHPKLIISGPVEYLSRGKLADIMKDSGADVVALAGGSQRQQIFQGSVVPRGTLEQGQFLALAVCARQQPLHGAGRRTQGTSLPLLGTGAAFLVNAADFGWADRRLLIWRDPFWPPAWGGV